MLLIQNLQNVNLHQRRIEGRWLVFDYLQGYYFCAVGLPALHDLSKTPSTKNFKDLVLLIVRADELIVDLANVVTLSVILAKVENTVG